MSGPITTLDADAQAEKSSPVESAGIEIIDGREATVGAMRVHRVLPRRPRRTVGAWCFADLMDPTFVTEDRGAEIGPHPHMGLHTVTWLVSGELLHHDSLGSEQLIRPGQLNLMTAGAGVAHAEEGTGTYRGEMQGIQLWVAQPEATRHGSPAFEHHVDLPQVDFPGADATVLVGEFAGAVSPARADTPLVGVDLDLRAATTTWPVQRRFEHALVVLDGAVTINGSRVVPGQLAYLGADRDELTLSTADPARVLLIGGEPFGEALVMWWNFVARSREEANTAAQQWNEEDERFGRVNSSLARIPAPLFP
jgi:redox-sensitive bicupin YhaK (pirin superfamily)